ncbi:MAG TPA: cytochrome d ubiquinol oxidase subunit II [Microbacterium sp.]|uniref:cytochrome d ubiquinol oxidase subunit II n=1 Tax=Microbacterium sp. TaxID=51671 RepID=UPI002B464A4F|nr:cytochrome d ubiquinol oxidase subunit II [Microbacterium sp.]HKT55301.1 cytochrome d ubiquinol oxidase subunit II [Microbacterium sp.]
MDLAHLWFWIIGILFIGYFVLDGFDFGVGMSLPFLGRDDVGRRQVINTIGPVWDLNETWLIVAGACLFAAFPQWYATLFSGFYLPLLVILVTLILRGVSFEYRHQRDSLRWKAGFDTMIVVGSAVPAFLWGVAFANIVNGVPLDAGHNFTGSLFTLLNPYSLLGGLTTLLLFFVNGLLFVALKTDGQVREDARSLAFRSGILALVVAAGFLAWTVLAHFSTPVLLFAVVAAVCLLVSIACNLRGVEGWAFGFGAVVVLTAVLTLWCALYPDVMPASNDPAHSLTIENASSNTYTLQVMSWAALIFLPLVVLYQGWTYWIFRRRVTRSHIENAAAAH